MFQDNNARKQKFDKVVSKPKKIKKTLKVTGVYGSHVQIISRLFLRYFQVVYCAVV